MRKIGLIFLVIFSLVLGMMISNHSGNSQFNITQDELDKFEDYLENDEYNKTYNVIEPSVINKIGNKGESLIEKAFSIFKNLLN